ncbi:MAG: hypothetical protein HPKKFMNG_02119 [Planctomycetes bacterium]|nr:hypothetical protein [Planctomycetota bacterium]
MGRNGKPVSKRHCQVFFRWIPSGMKRAGLPNFTLLGFGTLEPPAVSLL